MWNLGIQSIIVSLAICIGMAGTATAGQFKQHKFAYDIEKVRLDGWETLPERAWEPTFDNKRLGLRLPFDWNEIYRNQHEQNFESLVFYNNSIALCNYAHKYPGSKDEAGRLFHELFERAMEYTDRDGDVYWVRMDFFFPRPKGVGLQPPWYSALTNSFVLSGLLRATDCFKKPEYYEAIKGLVAAFKTIHTFGNPPPKRWFSYIDENGYLWFDEYPLPDGQSSRVLNGDIFSLFALALYERKLGDKSVTPLINGNLTTLRENVQRFRRKDMINSYELRSLSHPDYSPTRTIRQQCQLFKLTGDIFFKNMASAFQKDITAAGVTGAASALWQCF
ncbi:hypothetical protein DKP76_07760 [Falsochrobactrum shanghaiense]|uniref:D-glucuronyl C5-epimerase C-terminal domain-containing protein n=1 Tax=Falsochrobactrum shanghaiense TaxID=2201899 RepID=A0A316J8Q8_9HYPH|nr:D-glucuronyl C5-epimerase family protein [Falsochrobactrum shanghaiense]PWL17666.1 hypothetical protein DKP76_07760 [Falsochrobactrum shanghaiense]